MRKNLLFTAVVMAVSLSASKAQFNTAGIASFSGGIINLVPQSGPFCGAYTMGSAWSNTTVDFTKSFTLDFNAAFMPYNGTNGADGFVVTFGSDLNTSMNGSINGHAGYIGYYNVPGSPKAEFSHSMGIEFDIFDNYPDIGDPSGAFDHIAIAKNGDWNNLLALPVPIRPSAQTIEDSLYHHYRIFWDCHVNTLRIYLDPGTDTPRITMKNFTPSSLFTNAAAVKWGFTGGRGMLCSEHLLKDVKMKAYPCNPADTALSVKNIQAGLTVTVSPNPSDGVLTMELLADFNSVTVYDMAGRRIYAEEFGDTRKKTITLDKHAAGLYILEVRNRAGLVYRSHFTIQ